jgi:hypothetical protein
MRKVCHNFGMDLLPIRRFLYHFVILAGALSCILVWAKVEPKDLRGWTLPLAFPHWLWLLASFALFAIGLSSSGYSLYRSLRTAPSPPPIRELTTHEKLENEKTQLDNRITGLTRYINGDTYPKLPTDKRDQLDRQLLHMTEYSKVLWERIANVPRSITNVASAPAFNVQEYNATRNCLYDRYVVFDHGAKEALGFLSMMRVQSADKITEHLLKYEFPNADKVVNGLRECSVPFVAPAGDNLVLHPALEKIITEIIKAEQVEFLKAWDTMPSDQMDYKIRNEPGFAARFNALSDRRRAA